MQISQLVRDGGLTWEQQPPSGLEVVRNRRLGLRFGNLVIQNKIMSNLLLSMISLKCAFHAFGVYNSSHF